MKSFLILSVLAILNVGCTSFHGEKPSAIKQTAYAAPSSSKVSNLIQSTRDALTSAKIAASKQDWQTATTSLENADSKASSAQSALIEYQDQVTGLAGQLSAAIGERNGALKERDDARLIVKQKDDQIHELAKERDIIPFTTAICLGLWLVILTDIVPVPIQYRIWLKAIAFISGFAAGYALGRAAVRAIAQLLP